MKIYGIVVKPLANTIKPFGKDNYQGIMFSVSLGKDKGYANVMWGVSRDKLHINSKFPTINLIEPNKKYLIPVGDMKMSNYTKQDGTTLTNLTITTNYVDYMNPIDVKEWNGNVKQNGFNEFDKMTQEQDTPINLDEFFDEQTKDNGNDFDF